MLSFCLSPESVLLCSNSNNQNPILNVHTVVVKEIKKNDLNSPYGAFIVYRDVRKLYLDRFSPTWLQVDPEITPSLEFLTNLFYINNRRINALYNYWITD